MSKIKRNFRVTTVGHQKYREVEHLYRSKLHSYNDEPAVVGIRRRHGLFMWYKNNRLHRLSGPAIIDADMVQKRYFLDGHELTYKEWDSDRRVLKYKLKKL